MRLHPVQALADRPQLLRDRPQRRAVIRGVQRGRGLLDLTVDQLDPVAQRRHLAAQRLERPRRVGILLRAAARLRHVHALHSQARAGPHPRPVIEAHGPGQRPVDFARPHHLVEDGNVGTARRLKRRDLTVR